MTLTSLGEPIPGTGNLYAWGEGQVVKFYGEGTPRDLVEHLGRTERALHAAGLPVPAVGELLEMESGLGQIYERIEGAPMADDLLGTPDEDPNKVVSLAHVFAQVHAEIHSYDAIAEVPYQRQFLPAVIGRIDALPADLKEATLEALDKLPDGDRLCHGDFHPYNVLMSPRGPVVIDWNNAHIGNPLEDVARTRLMLSGVSVSEP